MLLAHGLLIIISASGSLTSISDLELDRCRGKGEQSQVKESNGGSSGGLGNTEGVIASRSDGSHLPSRFRREAKGIKEEVPCVLAWCL